VGDVDYAFTESITRVESELPETHIHTLFITTFKNYRRLRTDSSSQHLKTTEGFVA
jgi:hypothetical protein